MLAHNNDLKVKWTLAGESDMIALTNYYYKLTVVNLGKVRRLLHTAAFITYSVKRKFFVQVKFIDQQTIDLCTISLCGLQNKL